MPESAWGGDVEIEKTVIRARTWYQGEVAPKCADIPNDTKHGMPSGGTVIVQFDCQPNGQPAHRLCRCDEVRRRADLVFQVFVGPSMIMASIPIPAITAKCSGGRSSTVI